MALSSMICAFCRMTAPPQNKNPAVSSKITCFRQAQCALPQSVRDFAGISVPSLKICFLAELYNRIPCFARVFSGQAHSLLLSMNVLNPTSCILVYCTKSRKRPLRNRSGRPFLSVCEPVRKPDRQVLWLIRTGPSASSGARTGPWRSPRWPRRACRRDPGTRGSDGCNGLRSSGSHDSRRPVPCCRP